MSCFSSSKMPQMDTKGNSWMQISPLAGKFFFPLAESSSEGQMADL